MWEPEELVGWLHLSQSSPMQIVPATSESPAESQESLLLSGLGEGLWGAGGLGLVPLSWRGQQRHLRSLLNEWEAAVIGFLVHQELWAQVVQDQGFL